MWLARVDDAGVPLDARVRYLVDALQANPAISPAPDFKPLELIVKRGLVPECAMKVTRASEGADLAPFHPASDCTCAYEALVTGIDGGVSPQCTGADAGLPTDAGTCFANPSTHLELINQCTTATGYVKTPVLPLWDGGALPPLP